jgi:hypothetical protein
MVQSKRFTLLAVLGAAIMMLGVLVSSASAAETAPGYEQFAGCPTEEESPESVICVRSDVPSGNLEVGNKELPIENPLTIVGGLNVQLQNFRYNDEGGFLPVAQKVPGGVLGLTGLTWLLEFFGSEALTLYATTELAGEPTNFTVQTVTLPLKVHLTNPGGLLGSTCYLGSDSEPMTLNLTTGTTEPPPPNEPITGVKPKVSVGEDEIIKYSNGTYVDNSFAAPGVNGCKLVLFGFIPISINGLIDEISELPSPAGTNTAVENFNLEIVGRELVYP